MSELMDPLLVQIEKLESKLKHAEGYGLDLQRRLEEQNRAAKANCDIVDALRQQLGEAESTTAMLTGQLQASRDFVREARDDNDRLRTALEPFSKYACDEPHINEPDCYNCKARAALKPKE